MESRSAKTQRHVRSAVLIQCRPFGLAAEEAAWAVVVTLELSCAEFSVHVSVAGVLAVGSEVAILCAWFGAIKARCDTAELAAITWACRWCIYRMCVEPSTCGLPMVLHADSQHAISSVNVHVRPAVNDEAVNFARVALEIFSLVTVEWIAGYIGHSWNELADVAAKQAAHNPQSDMLEVWVHYCLIVRWM